MNLDPELMESQPDPFTLSVEPIRARPYLHGYHLGTDLNIARAFGEEIWRRVNDAYGCYTVALKRGKDIIDWYDGRDWLSPSASADDWQTIQTIHDGV